MVPIIEAVIYHEAANVLPKRRDLRKNIVPFKKSPSPINSSLFIYKKYDPKIVNQKAYKIKSRFMYDRRFLVEGFFLKKKYADIIKNKGTARRT